MSDPTHCGMRIQAVDVGAAEHVAAGYRRDYLTCYNGQLRLKLENILVKNLSV